MGRAWTFLRRIAYRRAARVVSVSAGVDACFAWLPPSRRAVIPNPVCSEQVGSEGGEPLVLRWSHAVAAMGRLEFEKGLDLLIRAFARLAAGFPDWGLVILGQGTQRSELESLVAELGMQERIELPGAIPNPFPTLKRADLFVLPSRSEGFGNALAEAMACGLAVVAADCWRAPPGIVRNGTDGILVPPEDVEALAAAMAGLMADDEKRRALGAEAARSVRRFELDQVSRTWDELLRAVVHSRGR